MKMPYRWSPAIAWLILFIFVVLYVVVFDTHAYFTGGRTMTGQFQDWLVNEIIGPFLFGGWVALFVGLTYHFFLRRVK